MRPAGGIDREAWQRSEHAPCTHDRYEAKLYALKGIILYKRGLLKVCLSHNEHDLARQISGELRVLEADVILNLMAERPTAAALE